MNPTFLEFQNYNSRVSHRIARARTEWRIPRAQPALWSGSVYEDNVQSDKQLLFPPDQTEKYKSTAVKLLAEDLSNVVPHNHPHGRASLSYERTFNVKKLFLFYKIEMHVHVRPLYETLC